MRITLRLLLILLAATISTIFRYGVGWGIPMAAASGVLGLLILVFMIRSPESDLKGPLLLFAIAVPAAIGTSFAARLDQTLAPAAIGLSSLIYTFTAFAGLWWAARPQDFHEAFRGHDEPILPTVAAFALAVYSSYPALLTAYDQPVPDLSPTLFLPGIAYVILAYLIAEPDARIEAFAIVFSTASAITIVIDKGFLPGTRPLLIFILTLTLYWSLCYLARPDDIRAILPSKWEKLPDDLQF